MAKRKPKGWTYHPIEHRLASKGIKTSTGNKQRELAREAGAEDRLFVGLPEIRSFLNRPDVLLYVRDGDMGRFADEFDAFIENQLSNHNFELFATKAFDYYGQDSDQLLLDYVRGVKEKALIRADGLLSSDFGFSRTGILTDNMRVDNKANVVIF